MAEYIPPRTPKQGSRLTAKIKESIIHDVTVHGLEKNIVAVKYNTTDRSVRSIIAAHLYKKEHCINEKQESYKKSEAQDVLDNAIEYMNLRLQTEIIKIRNNKSHRPSVTAMDVIKMIEVIAPYLKAKIDPKAKNEEPKKTAFRGLTLKPNTAAI